MAERPFPPFTAKAELETLIYSTDSTCCWGHFPATTVKRTPCRRSPKDSGSGLVLALTSVNRLQIWSYRRNPRISHRRHIVCYAGGPTTSREEAEIIGPPEPGWTGGLTPESSSLPQPRFLGGATRFYVHFRFGGAWIEPRLLETSRVYITLAVIGGAD